MVRLYDPVEGEILLDGKDIRILKLEDLRQTISVLFQDYTHFPLSVITPSIMFFMSEMLTESTDQRQHRVG